MKHVPCRSICLLFTGAVVLALMGCAKDRVLFVTKTSLSILEADTKPAGISIAYDRVEGYLGPAVENGEAPPVLGYFGSDGRVFTPKVKQVYATGNAARLIAGGEAKCTPSTVNNEDRIMFFGTSTTSGLKIGFTPNAPLPDSFVFGWRRKELSMVPLGTVSENGTCQEGGETIKKGQKFYPATLASVISNRDVPPDSPGGARFMDQQYFATGDAAIALAKKPELREMVTTLNSDAFADFRTAEAAQKAEAVGLVQCYAGLRPIDRPTVWAEAAKFGLFQDGPAEDTHGTLTAAYSTSVDSQGKVTDANRLARADRIYVTAMMAPGGFKPERAPLMAIHKKTVCKLSALNQS